MKGNGRKMIKMGEVFMSLQQEIYMMVIGSTEKDLVKVYINGTTVNLTTGNGKMIK